ncbi:class 1 fructose-bisphosphatase [Desulfurivibrio alkaliphilus]|uniref:Fructose-1,6-bisphosphatase class 1 n=1 Tax=Desulfurivibrio alkaliphilus (strain DSM 19089 / UNIQEM U267 / AHT2) TaxID=589865 RepID=D6Z017_DESAT|nr:class 1 fructose-bisphosphatase [Desulfurivibrio alkaliphilus]ADH85174.1 Inositol phosphatase/fructose-16-bisphosphatase [Desulfurivibrio alkaliphilus AHT 2]
MSRPLGITVSRHIMDSQRLHPEATGDLTGLLNELIVAAKTISAEVNMAGLADILGMSGKTNIQGEHVQKLDEFANNTIKRRMARCGYLCAMTSEEEADIIPVAEGYEGKYTLAFDPLDGSSNIDVNVSIGTIFSIHRRFTPDGGPGEEVDLLQPGKKQVAAGYIIYGSSTMLVFTTGDGVHGFTLDPSVGEFYLSHPDIRIPEKSKYFSINEGNWHYWQEPVRRYLEYLKAEDKATGRPYSARYIGSMVADFHRNLIAGGIFLYPRDSKDQTKTYGKLRLLYEAAPLAMVVEQAGGKAVTDDGRSILDMAPEDLHQRVPVVIGSARDVDTFLQFMNDTPVKPAG